MAKKKSSGKSKGINLLKGVTGSQLAKMIALVIVILAIPITVGMSRQRQNTQQEAAGVAPVVYQPYEITPSKPCKSGKDNWFAAKVMGTWACLTRCYEIGGQCYDTTGGKSTPKGLFPNPGYCPGSRYVVCYKPSGPERCRADYPSGKCQASYKACRGKYVTDECAGFSWYKCCTKL